METKSVKLLNGNLKCNYKLFADSDPDFKFAQYTQYATTLTNTSRESFNQARLMRSFISTSTQPFSETWRIYKPTMSSSI